MTFIRSAGPLTLSFALISLVASASPIPFQPVSRIRVRLTEGAPVAKIEGYDLRIYQKIRNTVRGPAAVQAERRSQWEFHCQEGRIRAKRVGGHAGRIGTETLDLQEPVVIRSPAGFISYSGRPYREELRIHSVGSLCEVINEVDLEKYLEGLVNAEFSSKWNEQSIGAQVVAARTYALYQIRQAQLQDLHYDVDASTSDQVYDGSIREDARAARVVGKTRGLVLTVGKGASMMPLKAFYHSTCGGATELPERVWGTPSAGFHHSVRCPFCAHSPAAHWNLELSGAQITESLRRSARNEGPQPGWPSGWKKIIQGKLIGIRLGNTDASGRIASVWISFKGRGSGELFFSGAKFREILGPAKFRSAAFQVAGKGADHYLFQGRGNGHGVGMCQWGAKVMGERGYKTAAILKFYYPDATLRKLW
jgi:stage II sporulation protein D